MRFVSQDLNDWFDQACKAFASLTLPPLVNTTEEFAIAYALIDWLVKRTLVQGLTRETELSLTLEKLGPHDVSSLEGFCQSVIDGVHEPLFEWVTNHPPPDLSRDLLVDTLGSTLQQSLGKPERKTMAANYTTNRSVATLHAFLPQNKEFKGLLDPFCGSGRLLTSPTLIHQSRTVWLNDIMPSAVLLATCRLFASSPNPPIIHATVGDAFSNASKYYKKPHFDLFLSNPPFTRTHWINKNIQQSRIFGGLANLRNCYSSHIQGQPGLHVYGIFLADQLLQEGGTLGLILPMATVLSRYSAGLQRYWVENYTILTIMTSEDQKAYSEGSNLQEIMIVLLKERPSPDHQVRFLTLHLDDRKGMNMVSAETKVHQQLLLHTWNWTRYFRGTLAPLREIILGSNLITTAGYLDLVRGLEMYGPEFFFIPNKTWIVLEHSSDGLKIQSLDEPTVLTIPSTHIFKVLRRPANYTRQITPSLHDYGIKLTSDVVEELWFKTYLQKTEHWAEPAKRSFGKEWFTHITQQLLKKEPFGYLFIVDKLGITTAGVLAHFTDEKVSCTKNFYLARNLERSQAKLLAAWFSSSWYLLLYMATRREVGGSYGRLQLVDYKNESLILDSSKVDPSLREHVLDVFEELRNVHLPPILAQVKERTKKTLDLAVGRLLGIEEEELEKTVGLLHQTLAKELERTTERD